MNLTTAWLPIVIAMSLVCGLLLASELGFRLGSYRPRSDVHMPQIGAVQGAALGLLGLLLGFSFAGASGRFSDRQQLIVSEANAISTAWLRADVLPSGARDELRGLLRPYAHERLMLTEHLRGHDEASIRARLLSLQGRIWQLATDAARETPAVTIAVLPPLNEMFDLLSTYEAATRRHLPALVLALLIGCAMIGTVSIGYGNGLSGHRHALMTTAFNLLVAMSLWATIDLDYPRRGLIRTDLTPLIEVRESMGE